MKLRVMSCHDISRIPVKTLRGIDSPITTVGRTVLNKPRMIVGRIVNMKANTTVTANRNPNMASLTSVSTWFLMAGPWSDTTMISMSGGRPAIPSRASLTAVVTSSVLASGVFDTPTPMPGRPLVREMLSGLPSPNVTSATSDRRTGPESDAPTMTSLRSSTESNSWVVFAITACSPSKTTPAGRVRLFSRSAPEIWNRETPEDLTLSASTTTRTLRSTSPDRTISMTPSIPDNSGRMRDSTMP